MYPFRAPFFSIIFSNSVVLIYLLSVILIVTITNSSPVRWRFSQNLLNSSSISLEVGLKIVLILFLGEIWTNSYSLVSVSKSIPPFLSLFSFKTFQYSNEPGIKK